MGRLIHASNGKLLRYGNFENSISKSYSNNYSCIKQTFNGYTYNLLQIYVPRGYIDRTSYMSCENINATHYYGSYNLKLNSNDDYWGNGTMYQTSNYLVKEENVASSLSELSNYLR